MTRRQTMPRQWLIADRHLQDSDWRAVTGLPRGSGILLLQRPAPSQLRRLRNLSARLDLSIVIEASGAAARVHNMRELRQALLRRTPIILVSPVHPTSSHPDWPALPRMRAATLARLACCRAIALGGMNEQRYAKIASLGFIGWAGISAFRT